MIKYLPANEHGQGFVCSDLHGHKLVLVEKLHQIDFDFGQDRLFCTGVLNDHCPGIFGIFGLLPGCV